MDKLNISPDEKIAGVPLARLLRNLEETSYNEGVMDLACRLTDCKAVIEELLARRADPSSSADELPPLPKPYMRLSEEEGSEDYPVFLTAHMRGYAREAIAADRRARQGEPVGKLAEWDRILRASVPERWKNCTSPVGAVQSYIAELERATHTAAPADAPRRKYYYRMDGCNAPNSHSPNCICWHDEGTGPLAKKPDLIRSWRAPAEDAREQQPEDAADLHDVIEFALELGEKEDANAAMNFLMAWNWESDGYLRVNWPEFAEFELSRRATGTDRAQAGEDA